jgi:hypothetical protein
MKKTLGTLATVAGLATAAPQINLQMRTDYRFDFRNAADSTLTDNSSFDLQYARLDLNGSNDAGFKYRMRLRFDFPTQTAGVNITTKDVAKLSSAKTKADSTKALTGTAVVKDTLKGYSDYVDYAYVKQALPMGFSVTAGKFFSGRGGYEGLTSGADLYQTTLVYSKTTAAFQSVLGVQPTWEGMGQTVSLTIANSGIEWATDKGVQHFMLVGGLWQGTFLGGWVQPHMSYFFRPTKATDDGQHLATIGVKSKIDIVTTELEWKSLTDTANAKGDNAFMHSTSLVTKLDFGMFRPQLKIFYDNQSVLDEKKSLERVGISPVLEFAPFEKTNLRWHVGYTYLDEIQKADAKGRSVDDRNWSRVFAGVAMNLDILK